MANDEDLPDIPGADDLDLSQFDTDNPLNKIHVGSDQDALRQINQHTSRFGRVATVLLLAAAGGIGWWGYNRTVGYESRGARLQEIAAMENRDDMLRALREELAQNDYPDMRQRIIMNLGHFRDAEAVPQLVDALDEAGIVRRAAAWALARIGLPAAEPAKAKLLAVLPETDERDRNQVVWTLAVLGESQAGDAIVEAFSQGQLQNMDDFDARVIANVLGVSRLSSDDLLTHDSEAVRVLTAHALSEVATSEVVDPLSRQLEAELARPEDRQSREVIRATASGLGRSNDARAARPLFAMLQSQPAMRNGVIEALNKSVAAPGLATLLGEASDEGVRRELVRLIAASHDDRVKDTLAGLLGDNDEEIKHTAAFALAEMGDRRAVPALFLLAQSREDDNLATSALRHIRAMAQPEDSDQLLALIEDFPGRLALILRALGATKNPRVLRTLQQQVDGDDARSAALAIADLGDPAGFRLLKDMAVRPRDVDMGALTAADRSLTNEVLLGKRRGAILALGRIGNPDAFPILSTVVEDQHDDYELRAMAAESIGQIGTPEQLQEVIGKVNNASLDDSSRRYYTQSLWQRPHAELSSQMLDLLSGNNPIEVKIAAGLALGYTASEANEERLVSMLDDEGSRRGAAMALLLSGGEASVARLMEVMKEDNDLREVLQQYVTNNTNDWFNLITVEMFETGAVWRRIRAADQLREGDGRDTYSYGWAKGIAVLRSGWDGTGGASPAFIRGQLWEGMSGDDATRRDLTARLFVDMPERGLLLRARDEGGEVGEAARRVMRAERAAE